MNRSQQLSTPYKQLIDLADSSKTLKTNNGRLPRWATYNLTNNKRLLNCDKKTDRNATMTFRNFTKPITSRLN